MTTDLKAALVEAFEDEIPIGVKRRFKPEMLHGIVVGRADFALATMIKCAGEGAERIAEDLLERMNDCASCACEVEGQFYNRTYFDDQARPIILRAIALARVQAIEEAKRGSGE